MIWLFLKAMAMGLAIAAPLGPIGALCISRTLRAGFVAGVAGGLGTALADAVYAALAAAGLAAASAALARIEVPLALAGGAFLLWLGVMTLRPRGAVEADRPVPGQGAAATLAATFALTLANPATILSFAAIFAGLGLGAAPGAAGGAVVVAGVFLGSLMWWVGLSGAVALARRRLSAGFARRVGIASGLMMAGFGLWAIGRGLAGLAG